MRPTSQCRRRAAACLHRQRDNRRLGRRDHGHRRLGLDDGNRRYVAGAFTTGGTEVATLNLSGTTITATGDGSGGLFANGTGSTVTATGVTITTHGNYDTVNNFGPAGVTNQSYPGSPGGGVVTLTNSSILTTGTQSPGVYTSDGGTTNLTGDSITTSGPNAQGVNTTNSGTTKVSGGSITTSGAQSDAVLALSGAQVTVQGTTISTSGNAAKGFDIQGRRDRRDRERSERHDDRHYQSRNRQSLPRSIQRRRDLLGNKPNRRRRRERDQFDLRDQGRRFDRGGHAGRRNDDSERRLDLDVGRGLECNPDQQ